MSECFCLGQTLSYECTTEGPISTVWQGTAFQCVGNRIVLRHSQFSAPQGTTGECNSNSVMITGRSLRVEGDCYTSQLNVTVGPSLNNQTVECAYSGGGTSLIGSSIIDISRGKSYKLFCIILKYPLALHDTYNIATLARYVDSELIIQSMIIITFCINRISSTWQCSAG